MARKDRGLPPGDRTGLPSRRPFTRKGNGYILFKCPHCDEEHLHRHAPPNAEPKGNDECFLRALIPNEMKRRIIDQAREDGISISALTRRVFLWYVSQKDQQKAVLPDTPEKHWSHY